MQRKKQVVEQSSVPGEIIQNKIYLIRGQKVMLDFDLASLYGVETKVLLQAVKRNLLRFPSDFLFQLSKEEYENLRSQIVTSSWGGRRYLPYAFTQEGIAMLSSILSSPRAIEVNIQIMRVFVKLREMIVTHKELAAKLAEVENKVNKYDKEIQLIFENIRMLMSKPQVAQEEQPAIYKRTKVGFVVDNKK